MVHGNVKKMRLCYHAGKPSWELMELHSYVPASATPCEKREGGAPVAAINENVLRFHRIAYFLAV